MAFPKIPSMFKLWIFIELKISYKNKHKLSYKSAKNKR